MEGLSNKDHGHGQQCGDWWGGEIKGLNGKEKIKIRILNKKIN